MMDIVDNIFGLLVFIYRNDEINFAVNLEDLDLVNLKGRPFLEISDIKKVVDRRITMFQQYTFADHILSLIDFPIPETEDRIKYMNDRIIKHLVSQKFQLELFRKDNSFLH